MLDKNLASWQHHEMWDFCHKFKMTGVENNIRFQSFPKQYSHLIKTDLLRGFHQNIFLGCVVRQSMLVDTLKNVAAPSVIFC